jgi:hypothetical protein
MNAASPESTASVTGAADAPLIPSDLGSWVERPLLLQWVMDEVDALDWSNPELLQALRANPGFQPRFLLVLMIFAYALGRCDSEEVVETYYGDSGLKRVFPNQDPSLPGIRRFRRDHRGLLRWCLAQVFKQALRHKFDLGAGTAIPAGLNRLMVEAATERLDAARHFDRSIPGE